MMAVALMASVWFTACSSDDEIVPSPNPKEEKDTTKTEVPTAAGGAVKAVLKVYDGHMHGTYNFHQNSHPQEVKYLAVAAKFVYHYKDSVWVADESNPKSLAVLSGWSAAYAMTIDYYDAKDSLINGKFIDNGADRRFQHFFMLENVQAGYGNDEGYIYDGDVSSVIDYVYCDTDPWNKSNKYDGAVFVGADNQLGFKGYFKFNESRVTFDLVIKLMEAPSTKYTDGKASPYYEPTEEQLANAKWQSEIRLPVNVFIGNNEYIFDFNPSLDKKESDYTEKEHLVIESLAKAFGITFMEAAAEFYFQLNGEAAHSENGFWF